MMMRSLPFLLIAGFALILMAGEADAIEPEWSYTTGDAVVSVAISADGEYIVAGSTDHKIYLFNKDNNTPLWSHETGNEVYSVSISADGEYVAAGSADNKVYLFDKDSSTPLWSYNTSDQVRSVAISADGEYIAAGSWDKVYLFGKNSSTPLWNYTTESIVWSVAISADGEYVAAGSADNKVYLFDKDSSTPLWSYNTGGRVWSVAISADGEYIVAGTWGPSSTGDCDENSCKVYLFDKDSSTPLWSYGTGDMVWSVAISADGEYIAAGFYYKVYLFNKNSSTPLWSHDTMEVAYSVAISADGEYISAGTGGWYDYNKVYLFNKDSSTPLWSYNTEGKVYSAAISADGKYIAAGSAMYAELIDDNKVYLFFNNLPPTATIDSISPSPARFDAEITFSGTGSDSDGTVVAYEWISSRDGLLSDEEDFSITGLSIGYHSITFRVLDNDGYWSNSNNATYTLRVYPNLQPTALIDSIGPSSARFDAEVTFNGTGSDSDGTIVAYEWISSRDGLLSNEEDFSITGLSIGYHSITFRVQDNDGNWSSYSSGNTSGNTTGNTTAELYVYPNAPPVGTIDSIEPSPAEEGTAVSFSGTGSDSDGTIVAYHWESSIDGELSTEEDFSSSGLSLGHHAITFRVQDNDGVWNNPQESGENGSVPGISLWIYTVPVAIAGDDVSTTPTVPVQFNGQGTDEDGTIAKYEWDFDGNGIYDWASTENGRELNIYNNEGTYTAVLRVTDNDGFTNTDTVVITVTEKKIQIDDEGNITVTDTKEDEEGIPALSVITAMAAVAVITLRRSRKP
jgi:outer membrane protein assembly factor BamB